ncbi:hypothetical protein [Phenylobacterium aquaticum]|nr:hypothetical protein [Phenylobacterium aquaticum]
MTNAQRIARIAGPSLVVLSITEALNLDAFAAITPPQVYLNGTILFVAGVSILQAHRSWSRDWQVLVTLAGWALLLAGLWRMIAPHAPQLGQGAGTDAVFILLIGVGAVLSFNGYRAERRP